MTGNPLLMLSGLLGIAGIQFLVLGLLGEVSARIYFESQNNGPYFIRELVNFNQASDGGKHDTYRPRAA